MSENVQAQSKRVSPRKSADGPETKKSKMVHEKGQAYSDTLKELLGTVGERNKKLGMQVAEELGIPKSTAHKIISLYKKEGAEAVHDHRHDRRSRAKYGKKNAELTQVILEWLHLDGSMTFEKIRSLVNLEIFREIVKQEGLELGPVETTLASGITEEHITEYLKNEKIDSQFQKQMVRTAATISSWLDGVAVSRKHLLNDESVANNEANCKARLTFAQQLQEALADNECHIIFVDEVPMLLNMHHPPGASEGAKISQHSHVYMAVDPSHGVIKSDSNFVGEGHDAGGTAPKHGLIHDEKHLKKFLDDLAFQMIKKLKAREQAYEDALKAGQEEESHFGIGFNKPVAMDHYIILECASDLIQDANSEFFDDLKHWKSLMKRLNDVGKNLYLVRTPPLSPTLNLAEFFNKSLRDLVNKRIDDLVRTEQEPATKRFLAKGHLLQIVIEEQLVAMARDGGGAIQPRVAYGLFYKAIEHIIQNGGKIQFQLMFAEFFGTNEKELAEPAMEAD